MIRFTDEGMISLTEAVARGEVVVVVAGGREPPDALRKLASDALVVVDVTERTTGIRDAFPAVVEHWVWNTIAPKVRGAADPNVLVVRSWQAPLQTVTVDKPAQETTDQIRRFLESTGGEPVHDPVRSERQALCAVAQAVNRSQAGETTQREAMAEIDRLSSKWNDERTEGGS